MRNYSFRCTLCGATYAADEVEYVCPRHGDAGVLDTILDFAGHRPEQRSIAHGPQSLWRYLDLLPISPDSAAALAHGATPLGSAGWTPLYRPDRLCASLGLDKLYVKDDGRNPSASFKDRASAFVVAKAVERGEQIITTASSGNAGAALACMAASAGIRSVVFVPEAAPKAKVAQLLIFGATVLLVKGTYDEAFDLCLQASREFGWYCRNTAYNPFTVEGKKTVSFEICEQLGWHAPDRVFVAVGDGNILSGVWKGFRELLALGWIERMPRLMGVQAEGSAACYNAWLRTRSTQEPIRIDPVSAHTIADSISAGLPRDGRRAVHAVLETDGEYVTVSDNEILRAMQHMAVQSGIFAEPAAAAAFAGLQKVMSAHNVGREETVVVLVTGSGLKDVRAAMRAAGKPHVVEPTLAAVKRVMGKQTNHDG
jgi:threonine synthase